MGVGVCLNGGGGVGGSRGVVDISSPQVLGVVCTATILRIPGMASCPYN